ncbi:MAG: NnrS family protein [Dehalococcoidia bacterium]|nr:NnrS family protein [Dehalococcoidia bacterium]
MRLLSGFREEERQYIPFVFGAIFFALILGFPLGFTAAHAAAQGGTLAGRLPAVTQLHGHLQLVGWFGLFVTGMGLRLVPRFTGVKVRPASLVPLTFALMAGGLVLRAVSQPWADEPPLNVLFAASGALEAAAALTFAWVILHCVRRGRPDEFHYSEFFAAASVWLVVALLINLALVLDAAAGPEATVSVTRSNAVTFVLLYGFVSLFVFAVSLRTFPIFFGRRRADPRLVMAVWALANVGIGGFAAAVIWRSYEVTTGERVLEAVSFAAVGAAFLLLLAALRIFEGTPHRLRESARRSMAFVRCAYAWLLVAAGMQVFFGLRALWDERPPAHYEVDAVRHFLALGFVTSIIPGMALLVMPRLAMRRMQGQSSRLVALSLLVLLQGAAAARGAGSLIANETRLEEGFWTMTAGGVLGILAMALFAGYLLRNPQPAEIPLSARAP